MNQNGKNTGPDTFTVLTGAACVGLGVLLLLVVRDNVEISGGWLVAIAAAAVGFVLTLGDLRSNRF